MNISDLVNVEALRELCDSFSGLTGMVTAILDLEGNVIFATGWQDICTRFHRAHPLTAQRCLESDTRIAGMLEEDESYTVYTCRNGLMDVAARITIGGEHVGNFFTGQFFLEAPDRDFFIRQAEEFGFDKDSYLDALSKVPIVSEEEIHTMMRFFSRLAHLIGEMGLAGKRFLEANIALRKNKELLEEQVAARTAELKRANGQLQEDINERARTAIERERLIAELNQALAQIKTLSGLLPICSYCKKIRDDRGYWNQLESYISEHSGAYFTHGICPECLEKEKSKLE